VNLDPALNRPKVISNIDRDPDSDPDSDIRIAE